MATEVIESIRDRRAGTAARPVVVDRDGRSAPVDVGACRRALRDDIERSIPRADCDWQ